MYICSVNVNIEGMTDVLFLIGFVVTVVWFFTSAYIPRTIWGLILFGILTMIFTPVITIPAQWIYAKYLRDTSHIDNRLFGK